MNDQLEQVVSELEGTPTTEGNLQRIKDLVVEGFRILAGENVPAPAPAPTQAPEATADQPETKSEAAQRQEASEAAASASA